MKSTKSESGEQGGRSVQSGLGSGLGTKHISNFSFKPISYFMNWGLEVLAAEKIAPGVVDGVVGRPEG